LLKGKSRRLEVGFTAKENVNGGAVDTRGGTVAGNWRNGYALLAEMSFIFGGMEVALWRKRTMDVPLLSKVMAISAHRGRGNHCFCVLLHTDKTAIERNDRNDS